MEEGRLSRLLRCRQVHRNPAERLRLGVPGPPLQKDPQGSPTTAGGRMSVFDGEWWGERIRLDTPIACRIELERCSTGLSYLDHAFTAAREELDAAEAVYAEHEA